VLATPKAGSTLARKASFGGVQLYLRRKVTVVDTVKTPSAAAAAGGSLAQVSGRPAAPLLTGAVSMQETAADVD
jgi:hypothetical protein